MQNKTASITRNDSLANGKADVPFASHAVRLSAGEWLVVGIALLLLLRFAPGIWQRTEKFAPGDDYRIPYDLSSDYQLYGRYSRWACSNEKIFVIGDSVVWGHYVARDHTLSHHLNAVMGGARFANLGLDGAHPAALTGLVKHFGRDISSKKVLLHFNPLWMSSKKHDLQIEKEFHFNHPKLVPQFVPRIACYKAPFSRRVWALLETRTAFFAWTSHLKTTYFESMDLPTWTLERPYQCPLRALMARPSSDHGNAPPDALRAPGQTAGGQNLPWVEPEHSLQWRFFQRTVELLRARDNQIFVLVGPFNEHVLNTQSAATYDRIKREVEQWLAVQDVLCHVAQVLPAELYCDTSHPVSEGYASLAEQLYESQSFRAFVTGQTGEVE